MKILSNFDGIFKLGNLLIHLWYIQFSKSEKVEIKKYSIIQKEELNYKIKKDLEIKDYIQVIFKGKTFEELSFSINHLCSKNTFIFL